MELYVDTHIIVICMHHLNDVLCNVVSHDVKAFYMLSSCLGSHDRGCITYACDIEYVYVLPADASVKERSHTVYVL